MSVETNENIVEVGLKEVDKDDCSYAILRKVADHLQIRLKGAFARLSVGVCFGSFTENSLDRYCIKENGGGVTEGLFKLVDGKPTQIGLPLPSSSNGTEMRLIFGDGTSILVAPPGWEIVTDEEIQRKVFLGTGPNWKVAAVKYVGI